MNVKERLTVGCYASFMYAGEIPNKDGSKRTPKPRNGEVTIISDDWFKMETSEGPRTFRFTAMPKLVSIVPNVKNALKDFENTCDEVNSDSWE